MMATSRDVGLQVLFTCVIALGTASVLPFQQERQLKKTSTSGDYSLSFAPYTEAFVHFKDTFGKRYTDQEEIRRFSIFTDNVRVMEAHNWRYHNGLSTFYMGVNQFSDLTNDEFQQMNKLGKYSTIQRDRKAGYTSYCEQYNPPEDAPESVDWAKQGAVTPVMNQGMLCGSGWAFSTTGAIEAQNFIRTKKLISLSEQQILDCCKLYGCLACDGGLMDQGFRYTHLAGGLESESNYTYQFDVQHCQFNKSMARVTVNGCYDLPREEEYSVMCAVAKLGPAAAVVDAHLESFQSYKGGVYYSDKCASDRDDLTHAILIVGYGKEPNGVAYWMVKNSWGKTWGLDGYIKMARYASNNCGIATMASIPFTSMV